MFPKSCVRLLFACFKRFLICFMFNTVLCRLPLFSSCLFSLSLILCPPVDFRSFCAELSRIFEYQECIRLDFGGVIYLVAPHVFQVFVFAWTYEQFGPPHLLWPFSFSQICFGVYRSCSITTDHVLCQNSNKLKLIKVKYRQQACGSSQSPSAHNSAPQEFWALLGSLSGSQPYPV